MLPQHAEPAGREGWVGAAPGAQTLAVVFVPVVDLGQDNWLREVHVRQGGCRSAVVRAEVLRPVHS